MEQFWGNSVDTLERSWDVLGEIRKQEIGLQSFDNALRTQKRSATEPFNERHRLSPHQCAGFLARCRLPGSNKLFLVRSQLQMGNSGL
jgi:hypothetical protein